MSNNTLNHALAYIASGWHVFPLRPLHPAPTDPEEFAKRNWSKEPFGKLAPHGANSATNDPEVARRWWTMHPDCGIGIACAQSGLAVLDVDPRNRGDVSFDALEGQHGQITSDVHCFSGRKGGFHLYFQNPERLPLKSPGAGIDMKASGYVAAPPTLHAIGYPEGTAYEWEASSDPMAGCKPSTLPDWLAATQRVSKPATSGAPMGEVLVVDPATVRDLRSALGQLRADDRDQWVAVGHALKELGEVGRGLWVEWSQTSEKFTPADVVKWDTFAPGHTGYQSVFAKAQRAGWVNPMASTSTAATFPPLADGGDDPRQTKHRHEVILVNGADLTPEPVRWLWPDWLALGKLHILAGAPGQGKTTIALAMAATVTIGGRWPDGSRCEAGNVLVWSGEDDPADTLLPRLLAAGADRSRVYFVSGTRLNDEVQSFDPARDMAALEAQAVAIGGVKLLMVDPVVSAVAGDSHKNTEVRRALQPLVDLASRMDAAAIGISHFSKGGQGSDPASRVVGSIAFTAVARVVLVAAKVKAEDGDDDRRILARGKSNIGPDNGGFEYHIEQSEPLPGIKASYIAWGKAVDGTARDLLNEPDGESADDRSAVDAAQEFLREALASGPTPTKTLQAECKDAGVSWASVRRASEAMCVVKRKGEGSVWYWNLPMLLNQLAQDAQHSNVEQVEQHGEQVDFLPTEPAPETIEDSEVF